MDNISDIQDLRLRSDVRRNEDVHITLSECEQHSVEEVQLDSGAALILCILVLASVRIIELGFLRVNDDVILRKFAEVDLRPVDLEFRNISLRRDISFDNIRLTG